MISVFDLVADVTLAREGNAEAFARLIERTRNTITCIALAIVKDIDNSEEVAQMVFIATWQNLDQLNSNASFLPWLRQMTRYTAYNFLRDNKVSRKVTGEQAEKLLADFCHPQSTQDDLLAREQQSVILNDFISELPDDSREIVLLYYREEQSTKQVAQLLELSEQNVRKKISRIRGLLKAQLLEKYGNLILSTMPTASFTALVVSSIVTSSPVVAATAASTMASGKSGLLSKMAFVVGGAMLGVMSAVIAVVWAAKMPLLKITDKQANRQLRKYRNQTVAWLIVTGILFALSYELTTGWIGPMSTYTLLAAGLMKQLNSMANFAIKNMQYNESKTQEVARKKADKRWSIFGAAAGLIAGYSGLIIGLLNSGRM